MKGIIAAVIVVLGATATWFFVAGEKAAPVRENKEKPKKAIEAAEPAPAKPTPPKASKDDPKFDGLDKSRLRKAANGTYVYLPKIGEERYPGERAQALARMAGTNRSVVIDRRVVEDPEHPFMFHNSVQSDLVQYARPGEFAVPINPNIRDEDAWAAIKEPIVDHKNDSDRQLEEKQYVRDLLQDLKKHMEAGGHARDYFVQLQERQSMEEETMRKTRDDVRSLINEGKIDDARDALKVYNQYLKQKGLPEMRFRKLNMPKPPAE